MKKRGIWIIVAALILVVGFIIFMNIRQKKLDSRPFVVYEYPSSITITNGTSFLKADTIILSLAHHIFEIDTMDILLYYIPDHINAGEMEFYGIVQQMPFDKKKFLILVNRKLNLPKLFETLSHEFVHIDQYSRGDLEIIGKYAIWKGDTIDMTYAKYEDRPFEIEAFSGQSEIAKELKKLLYE
jgi:hypothetical protein